MSNSLRLSGAVLATAFLLGTAACGTSSPSPATDTSAPGEQPSGSGGLVLQVRDGGGLVPISPAADIPRFSLYEDGTLVTSPTPKRSGLPGPRVAHLSAAQVRSVVGAAHDAGLPHSGTLGRTPPADGPVRSYTLDGKLTTTVAPALRDCTRQRELCALDKRLGALAEPSETYRYSVMAAVFNESAKGRSPDAATWPLGPLSQAGKPTSAGRCLLLRGTDLKEVREAARTAKSSTWTDGTASYRMALRPLLPGEDSCADVVATD
ncbi:hypothetical protein [Streptomyces avermitilis]|uniref:hypothetical protein n=1 Tax=Streptomyces avermitilis TaxID=33903 RepID=UPI0033AC6CA4